MSKYWRIILTLCLFLFSHSIFAKDFIHSTFMSAEHMIIGDEIFISLNKNQEGQKKLLLSLPNGLQLTYGDIVAMGDFYGNPEEPITLGETVDERKTRFIKAFNSFAVDSSATLEVQNIVNIMHDEANTIEEALKQGKSIEEVYKQISHQLDIDYNCATGGGCSTYTWWLTPGRYISLMNMNYDHFGDNAIIAYQAGHEIALQEALHAHQTQDIQRLQKAYAMNAFACHFLTDRFASGHIRTPRYELSTSIRPNTIGSLLADYMHDEENEYGLHVHNLRGDHWIAFGDKTYFEAKAKTHVKMTIKTVQASTDEIFYAYQEGSLPTTHLVNALIPVPDESENKSSLDISPLFYIDTASQQLMRRSKLNDYNDKQWTNSWWGWTTFAALAKERGISVIGQAKLVQSEWKNEAIKAGLITDKSILRGI